MCWVQLITFHKFGKDTTFGTYGTFATFSTFVNFGIYATLATLASFARAKVYISYLAPWVFWSSVKNDWLQLITAKLWLSEVVLKSSDYSWLQWILSAANSFLRSTHPC